MLAEEGEVGALTLEGVGILGSDGKRVLVPGVVPGDRISFTRRRRRRNFDEGRLLDILTPGPDRVEPRCAYFGACGGCALQHLAREAQLSLKEQALLDALARIGGVHPARVLPPLAGAAWAYRRRARLGVRDVAGKSRVLVGFRERERPYVADMATCDTVRPEISRLLLPLSGLIGDLSIRRRLPQVEVTVADNATALVLRTLDTPSAADLRRLVNFEATEGVRLYLQPGGPATAVPLTPEAGTGELTYAIPAYGLELSFGPTDFIQVHGELNLLMIDQALDLLDPRGGDRVLDLYAGIGNFTLPLARRAAAVLGLEGAPDAVARLAGNAARHGMDQVRAVQADLAGAGTGGSWTRERFELVLLDPPRTGAAPLLDCLPALGARRIVYVSCHPGTLARDLGRLVGAHGYRLEAAGIMDMFPQTSHVESMALLTRD